MVLEYTSNPRTLNSNTHHNITWFCDSASGAIAREARPCSAISSILYLKSVRGYFTTFYITGLLPGSDKICVTLSTGEKFFPQKNKKF